MRYVIIGASAAGIAAAEAILAVDRLADVIVVSEEEGPPYTRPMISYWLANQGHRALLPMASDVINKMDFRPGTRAVALDARDQRVRLDCGETLSYDRLLLATGAISKPLGLEGEEALNVVGMRTLHDVSRMDAELQKSNIEHAVILGGGLAGIKAAQALVARGVRTTLCVSSSHPLSQNLDAAAGALAVAALEKEGIRVRLNYRPHALETDRDRVRRIHFEAPANPEDCDLVIRAKGVLPRTELLEGHGFPVLAGIPTDTYLRTPLPNIWAAGDVALTRDRVSAEQGLHAIWPAAIEQGKQAGRNMTGLREEYPGSLGMNSLRIGDLFFIGAGVTRPRDRNDQAFTAGGHLPPWYRSIVVHDGVLVGAVSVGHADQAGVIISAVQQGARLDEVPFDPLDLRMHWGQYAMPRFTSPASAHPAV